MQAYENSLKAVGTVFEYITNTGCGGAISLVHEHTELFLSSCVFLYCSVQNVENSHGGAVYYSSAYQQFIGNKLCATHCSAYRGSFLYLYGSDNSLCQRIFNLSMYSSCLNTTTVMSYYPCMMQYGYGKANDINATDNKSQGGTFLMHSQKESLFSYGYFVRNQGDIIFGYAITKTEPILSYAVFLSCVMNTGKYGVIVYSQNYEVKCTIKNCTLIKNYKPYFDLFSIGSMEVLYCLVDEYSHDTRRQRLPSSNNIIFTDKDSYVYPIINSICDVNKYKQNRVYSAKVISIFNILDIISILATTLLVNN